MQSRIWRMFSENTMRSDFNLPPGVAQRDIDGDEQNDRAERELEKAERMRDLELREFYEDKAEPQ